MTIAFFGKGVFAEVTKLRILRRDHPELSGWVVNPMINCPYKIQRWEDKDRGEALRSRNNDWSYIDTSQGTPQATEPGKSREGFSPTPFGEKYSSACTLILDFWPPDNYER